MNKVVDIILVLFSSFLLGSCTEDAEDQQLTLPTNLVVDVDVSDNGSGSVSVTATADNVNFYNIYFGDVANEVPVKVNDGRADHTYSEPGNYTVKVTAHATDNQFIEKETSITVELLSIGDSVIIPTTGFTSPTSYAGMTLAWEDDFSGSTLNANYWTPEIGRGTNGWGNNELQYYRAENTTVRDGYLVITAKKEGFADAEYTSSRLITRDKKSFQYGRIDIRAALPKGQGIWPALWMLGGNFQTVGWPACGEIDIMEMIGGSGRENTVHGTVHWDNNGTYASYTGSKTLSTGMLGDEFHVYSIVWNADAITWYLDNIQFNTISITPAGLSEFKQPFFFIFNVAVGGNWPGSPNTTTTFPQHMIVDYVRVFQ